MANRCTVHKRSYLLPIGKSLYTAQISCDGCDVDWLSSALEVPTPAVVKQSSHVPSPTHLVNQCRRLTELIPLIAVM